MMQVTVCKLSSLSRYQPRAGPDGGDGGRGGSIVLIADNSVKEFAHLPKHIKAENGGDGRGDDCKGKNGSDRTFQVNKQNYVGFACKIHLGHTIKLASYEGRTGGRGSDAQDGRGVIKVPTK